jgi:2,4-dienoyl-CoA reductase-like NADH-dependent reductase (Old Yellow Enzyme family)
MSQLFQPLVINGVHFENRMLRSSVGGRTCNYDGTVTEVWKNFERRFAEGGVGGIISTTFHVNQDRLSPPQYPSIAGPKFVPYLKKYVAAIKAGNRCKYIVQIGDPGYSAYSSLFPDALDAKSSSGGFDLAFGYNNLRRRMSLPEIEKAVRDFADAAARVRDACADGLEITITKGYLIHQFLNPAINRRNDRWGGDADRRFEFLRQVIAAVRGRIGRDFLLGIRLSGEDLMGKPFPLSRLRLPWHSGNGLPQMLDYARRLKQDVDYLHVVAGYGFPNPRDVPGRFPFDEVKLFFNSIRHLSLKASFRATCFNFFSPVLRPLLGAAWRYEEGVNLELARQFKAQIGLPVIANGGFQGRKLMEEALASGGCDLISMARSLIANPQLPRQYETEPDRKWPDNLCNHCNRCVGRTGTSPLGCYNLARFKGNQREMLRQIMEWNRPDPVASEAAPHALGAAAIKRASGSAG